MYKEDLAFSNLQWLIYHKILPNQIKLATIVEGDPKAPFSIATTPRCRGGALLHSQDCSTLPLNRTL